MISLCKIESKINKNDIILSFKDLNENEKPRLKHVKPSARRNGDAWKNVVSLKTYIAPRFSCFEGGIYGRWRTRTRN